jgi:hypothetical protein
MLTRNTSFGLSQENLNGFPWDCTYAICFQHFLAAAFFSIAGLLVSGCIEDSGTNPMPELSMQQFTVDQTGGTLVFRSSIEDVTVTLTIPPGALDASTVITIDHAQNFSQASGLVSGAVFDFGPEGLVFNMPVELDIAYGAGMIVGLTEDELRIHEASGLNWLPLLGSVDTANNTVNASIDSVSIFGLKTIPGPDPGPGDPGPGGPDTWATIQADILQGRCVFCHGGSSPLAGLSWEADQYDAIVTNGYMSTEITSMLEIDPGNSAASYLIWKLQGAGPNGEPLGPFNGQPSVRMPATGPPYLDQADIDRIAAWIDAGAPGVATDPGGGGDPGGGDPSSIIPTWYGVQANIFGKFCTMCHSGNNPPAGLSWEVDQYDAIVTNQRFSTQITTLHEVEPVSPETSYIIWKLQGAGPNGEALGLINGQPSVRMPATGIPLDQALIDVVVQWISDGAPLGDPADANSGGSTTPTFPVGSWMYVWNESLQVCTLCHSATPSSQRCGVDFDCPPKDVVLTADNYNGVVDDTEVEPFNLNGSKLWDRVTDPDPDKRMPFGMPALTPAQLNIISDWILDGAPFCPLDEVCP